MASDFTVTWQFSQREQLFFFSITVTDQTPCRLLYFLALALGVI
jgi:hypothetical protein